MMKDLAMEPAHDRITVRRGSVIAELPFLLAMAVAASAISNLLYAAIWGLVAFGVSVLRALQRGSIRTPERVEILVVAFAAYAVTSVAWAPEHPDLKLRTTALAYGGLSTVFVLTYRSSASTRAWRFIGFAYVFGALVDALLVVGAWMMGLSHEGSGRYSIAGVTANYTAYSMATALPFAVALFGNTTRRSRYMVVVAAFVIVLGLAVGLTGCRGAAIAYIGALVVWLAASLKRRPGAAFAVAATVTAAVWYLAPNLADILPARLYLPSEVGEDVSSGRYALWERAFDVFRENPILGSGADSYPFLSAHSAHAHNVFLTVLAELGVVGMALFAAAITSVFLKILRSGDDSSGGAPALMLILTWSVIALTGVWLVALPPWIAFAWLAGAHVRTGGQAPGLDT